jgi:hypothetical protein
MLEVEQPRDQARRRGRSACARREKPGPLPLEHLPVNQGSQLHQFVARVDHVDKSRAEEVILFGQARAMLHWQHRICKVSKEIIQNLARHGEKNYH